MSQEETVAPVRVDNSKARRPIRVGRVERDIALKVIEEAYVEERITLVEYDERMRKVLSATTREELDFIVEDLTFERLTFPHPQPASPVVSLQPTQRIEEESEGDTWWRVLPRVIVGFAVFLFPLVFLASNAPPEAEKLKNGVEEAMLILKEETFNRGESLQLAPGEGLGTIREAGGTPVSGLLTAKMETALNATDNVTKGGWPRARTQHWNIASDGTSLTFTTNYGFIHSNEVTCVVHPTSLNGEGFTPQCAVERVK